MAEEVAKHLATKDKLSEVESSHATIIGILEQEKNSHKDTIDKLANEEANHLGTKNELSANRVSQHESEMPYFTLVVSRKKGQSCQIQLRGQSQIEQK